MDLETSNGNYGIANDYPYENILNDTYAFYKYMISNKGSLISFVNYTYFHEESYIAQIISPDNSLVTYGILVRDYHMHVFT